MEKIKLLVLLNNKEIIEKLKNLKLSLIGGDKVFQLRKNLKKMEEEIKLFDEAKEKYILENGVEAENGGFLIEGEEEIKKANKFLFDMANSEIEVSWEKFLDQDTLQKISEDLDLKIQDIDILEDLKILEI